MPHKTRHMRDLHFVGEDGRDLHLLHQNDLHSPWVQKTGETRGGEVKRGSGSVRKAPGYRNALGIARSPPPHPTRRRPNADLPLGVQHAGPVLGVEDHRRALECIGTAYFCSLSSARDLGRFTITTDAEDARAAVALPVGHAGLRPVRREAKEQEREHAGERQGHGRVR